MTDRVRAIEEILDLLKDAAKSNGFFEIGPDETTALWAHIEKQRSLMQGWSSYAWKDGKYIDDVQEYFDEQMRRDERTT